jgi:uncharacterized protein involved in type VI secretion and phage assembly
MSDCGCNAGPSQALRENHLATVVSVADASSKGRIRVRLLTFDGGSTQDGPIDARLCVPFAGGQRGAFLVPDVNDEVIVAFIGGDPRQAVVIGAVWNGRNAPPETLGGNGEQVDRWSFVGKSGTRIAIVEENGNAQIHLQARASGQDVASIVIDRSGGGKITLKAGQTELVLDPGGMKLNTPGNCEVQCTAHNVTSATMDVQAALSSFSGVVDAAAAVQTAAVIGATYTPGAGNVW